MRKYCFINSIINVPNSLLNWVVSADTTNNFKTKWQNQDNIYDFTAMLHGTGGHSELLN